MSETVRNAGPGMIPEPVEMESVPLVVKPLKRKLSSPSQSWDPVEPMQDVNGSMPRKRSMVMSLANLISEDLSMPPTKTESPFTSAMVSMDPSSPTAAVVPLSPKSYQREHEPAHMQPRSKSTSNDDDHAPSSWTYSKAPKVAIERGDEQNHPRPSAANSSEKLAAKPPKKRQEPHELSELGIGQRASANLHAAYVNGQLRERSKAGLSPEAAAALLASTESTARAKNASKPKPSHACPEPDCDKSFSRLFNLRSHMRTHSKARPFVCADCNFAFSRRHDRDRHAKKHLSKKPYKCIVCEATFVRQDALVRHLRMDGVQNQCMAAMEQRSMQLGENGGGYMLAAKQQAYDEQQQEDQRDADEKQADIQSQQHEIPGAEMEHADADSTVGNNGQCAGETRKTDGTEDGRADEKNPETINAPKSSQLSSETGSKDHDRTHVGPTAGEYHRERQTKDSSHSRQSSPRLERSGQDLGSADRSAGHDVNKQYSHAMLSRYERPAHGAHQELAGEDRFGSMSVSHPRSFYPSPSRSHSRSHSQSQPYSSAAEYHSSSYHESASSAPSVYPLPPSHVYHGSQPKYSSGAPHAHTYRELQPNYAYQPTSSRFSERAHPSESRGVSSFSEQHGVDSYSPYPGHESAYERVGEGPGAGPQPWTTVGGQEMQGDLSELEMDKTIFEAAMGLLRIRASQW
ncbi:hypothetical protein BGZ50_004245 [Haplosporangium sp. Z 11]|nr:hypothetical protein BGZ50_004245 [Haplosporangium sp. Z 11]